MSRFLPPRRAPLGLPEGSVRAVLTLVIVLVVCMETAAGRAPEMFWNEALMIAMAHYFTSRRFVDLPASAIARLEQEGLLERPHPLFLPRHSIRAIILLVFVLLAVYLHFQGRLWEPTSLSVLGVMAAYLLGMVLRSITNAMQRFTGRRPPAWLEDTKAVAALLAVSLASMGYFLDDPGLLPDRLQHAALAVVLFYFGSR